MGSRWQAAWGGIEAPGSSSVYDLTEPACGRGRRREGLASERQQLMDKLLTVVYRLTFLLAFAVAALAVAEGVVQLFGQSIMRGAYSAGRLFELSGILMTFVIALLLRDIRDDARRRQN
jgi:hypothetical protein